MIPASTLKQRVIPLLALALLWLSAYAAAQFEAPKSSAPAARYFRTEYLGMDDGRIYLRGRFEVTATETSGRTFGVFFQLRSPSKELLRFESHPDGRMWKAEDVVLPRGQTIATWVRDVSIPLSELAGATNLRRGQRIGIWAQCDLWDRTDEKYLGFGSGDGPTFFLSTDAAGKAIGVDAPDPPREGPIHIPQQRLRTEHLRVREGVKIYREEGTPVGARTFFDVAGRTRHVGDMNLFHPVDTQARARELVELRLANHWVVPSAAQYRDLRDTLRDKARATMVVIPAEPPSYGFTVEPGPGGTFVARVLYYIPNFGVICHEEMTARPDGRLERRNIRSVTNGIYEGWPRQPALPDGERESWDAAARAILGREGLQIIPDRIERAPEVAPSPRSPETSARPADLHQRALKSVAWAIAPSGRGTAWLADRDHRLLVTNYHVAEDHAQLDIVFPAYAKGSLIVEKAWYERNAPRYRARVIDISPSDDLAVLQLDRLPASAQALPLAAAKPSPGDAVHSVGNPGPSDALWVYTGGAVRAVYHRKWVSGGADKLYRLNTEVIETQSPTNPGDSGGPLLNDRGEVVGITQGGRTRASLVNWFISAGRVRAFLDQSRLLLDPRTADGLALRGARRRLRGLYDDAAADFTAALLHQPNSAVLYSQRAAAYHGKKDYHTALADLQRALELDPNLADAWYWRGRVYTHQKAYRDAVTAYSRAIQLTPNDAELFFQRGEALARDGQPQEAIRDYSEALRLDPDHALAHWGRGEVYAQLERYVDALREYNWAEQLGILDARLYNLRGEAFHALKEYDDALKCFLEADRLAPKTPAYLTSIGQVLTMKSQLPGAVKACSMALAIDPNYARAYYYRGLAREMMEQIDAAQPDYEKACELRPTYESILPKYDSAYLYVVNKSGESINVSILYEAKTSAGTWRWYPGERRDQAASYPMLPGQAGKPNDDGTWIEGRRVRIWAVGQVTRNQWIRYRDQDFWLAQPPYRAALGKTIRVFRFG